jgi:hypothetical protein
MNSACVIMGAAGATVTAPVWAMTAPTAKESAMTVRILMQ